MNVIKRVFIPFFLAAVVLFCGQDLSAQSNLTKIKSVCIDAGHGGKDPGAVGSSSHEKRIALSIALKLGKMIESNFPEVKVVYTRKTDVFVDLKRRSKIANDAHADLFISIHLNSAEDRSARGIETLVLGSNSSEQNMRTAMRENSALKYESDYSVIRETFDPTRPESYIIFNLIRNVHLNESLLFASLAQEGMVKATGWRDRKVKQQPVWVLKDASMPAVLVEVGFISNPTEERALRGETTQNTIAKSLFNAFKEYKRQMESNTSVLSASTVQVSDNEPLEEGSLLPETSPQSNDDWFFAIQIGNLSEPAKNNRIFGVSESVYHLRDGNRYKYYICKTKSYEEVARKAAEIRKKIKGAFVIGVKEGKLVNVADLRKIAK